jgi:hypothetical protein
MVHSVGLLDRSPVKTVVDLPGSVTLPCPPVPCSQTPPESPAPSPLAGTYWCLPSFRPCRPPVDRITRLNRFTCVTARTSLCLRLAHVVASISPRLDSKWGGSFPLPGRELHPLEAPGLPWRTEKVTDVRVEHPVHVLPHDADPQRVQRVVLAAPGAMFSLAGCLPSGRSADGCPSLFAPFVGTMRPSDSPPTCALDFELMPFSSQPAVGAVTGVGGVSRFSRVEFPGMPGVSDCAESAAGSR